MIIMFGSLPSHAAKAIKKINDNSELVTATETITKKTTLRKIMSLIKVIFDGANVKGNFRTWQAGFFLILFISLSSKLLFVIIKIIIIIR